MKQKILFHLTASGFYTALCLASISLSTDIVLLKSKPNWWYSIFLFFATFFYYNFQKISWFGHHRMLEKNNIKYSWPAKFPGLLLIALFIGFAGTAALFSFSIHEHLQWLFCSLGGALAFFYNHHLFFKINLRSKKGFKAFVIALVSIIAGVLVPAFGHPLTKIDAQCLILYTSAQLLFISALCIAADMRDVKEDREDNIKTFPVSAGNSITKKIITILLVFHIVLLYLLYKLSLISLQQLEVFILMASLSVILVFSLKEEQNYYHYTLGIDGLIVCQSICIIIIN